MNREEKLLEILREYDQETRGDLELMYIEDMKEGFSYEDFLIKLFECVNIWRNEREYDQEAIDKLMNNILNMDR